MKNLLKLFLVIAIIVVACDESSDVIYERNATIVWTGNSNIDGCGFFIEIDSVRYKPESESVISYYFKQRERTSVTLQYIDLPYTIDYNCANSDELKTIDAIKIISIALNHGY